uniref:C-type lectin domain-containing protein n=1 Tax=Oreochromis niloticus TaxID=8128 RepID=A0A669F227_ORENI
QLRSVVPGGSVTVAMVTGTYHTDLTSIRSKEEKSNITLTLNGSVVQYVWIGLYRDPWTFWSDNTTSTFTNWLSGQPNNYYPPEDCVAFNLKTGKWCDSNCSSRVRFFCFTGEGQASSDQSPGIVVEKKRKEKVLCFSSKNNYNLIFCF